MKHIVLSLAMLLGLVMQPVYAEECAELLDHSFRPLAGDVPVKLCEEFQGKVVLVVNTASKCAFTGQYEQLEALFERYRAQGLVVVGFPSNDFAGQEPGSEEQIKDFCRTTYGVKFPMFEKTRVTRDSAHPLYRELARVSGEYPRWNFHKYLLARDGSLVGSFPSALNPGDLRLISAIEQEL